MTEFGTLADDRAQVNGAAHDVMRELGTFADGHAQANGAAHDVMAVAQTLRAALAARAAAADDHGAFPEEGLREIRKSGLMGLVVDRQYGGMGASFSTMAEVAQILAEGCTSTAMIWAMHCQQVATLADHGGFALRESVLPRIAAGELYIASVTSERNKAGELLTAIAPLLRDEDNWIVERDAPVVTGGANADAYLATMRASPEANPSDVVLVFVERAQMDIRLQSGWSAMGMRSTQSAGMSMKGAVPHSQLIVHARGFKQIAVATMVPVGHIAWAATWIGAARGAFRRLLALLRDPARRGSFPLQSELFVARLARARLALDTASAFLRQVTATYDRLRSQHGVDSDVFSSPWFNIHINGLKILASEKAFAVVDQLVQLAGLRHGYLKGSDIGLERCFRDLRSASLMYANDKLYVANGKLSLLDRDVTLI
jgi:acyl-CoA dehydrogenase